MHRAFQVWVPEFNARILESELSDGVTPSFATQCDGIARAAHAQSVLVHTLRTEDIIDDFKAFKRDGGARSQFLSFATTARVPDPFSADAPFLRGVPREEARVLAQLSTVLPTVAIETEKLVFDAGLYVLKFRLGRRPERVSEPKLWSRNPTKYAVSLPVHVDGWYAVAQEKLIVDDDDDQQAATAEMPAGTKKRYLAVRRELRQRRQRRRRTCPCPDRDHIEQQVGITAEGLLKGFDYGT